MLKQMTYKEMSNMSNQVFSELHHLTETSSKLDSMFDRHVFTHAYLTQGNFDSDSTEDINLPVSILVKNSIKLALIESIDYRVNFLVTLDSNHGLGIIDDIVKCLPKCAYDQNYGSTLISNYFKGDYFND